MYNTPFVEYFPEKSGISFKDATAGKLRAISGVIPYKAVTLVCGPSGVGKTSLLFGTLFQEASRRLVRKGQSEKNRGFLPGSFSEISGLLPTVYISQFSGSGPAALPLGELLGVPPLLEALLLKHSLLSCSRCEEAMKKVSIEAALEEVLGVYDAANALVLAEFRGAIGEAPDLERLLSQTQEYRKQGYRRCLVGNTLFKLPAWGEAKGEGEVLQEELFLNALEKERGFSLVLDSLPLREENKQRLLDARSLGHELGAGKVQISLLDESGSQIYSSWIFEDGFYCSQCCEFIPQLTPSVFVLSKSNVCKECKAESRRVRACRKCFGTGLGELSTRLLYDEKPALELFGMSAEDLIFSLGSPDSSENLVLDIKACLKPLVELAAGHLPLSRPLRELSSGEQIKAAFAGFIGAELQETLFIVDEPSAVLHPEDRVLLYKQCRKLAELGNTVVIADCAYDALGDSDHLIVLELVDEGERSSRVGIVSYEGSAKEWNAPPQTAIFKPCNLPAEKNLVLCNSGSAYWGAEEPLELPLEQIVAVCGRTGSGKTTLLRDAVAEGFKLFKKGQALRYPVEGFTQLSSVEFVPEIVSSAAGKSLNSSLASVLGVAKAVAEVFSSLPAARRAGFSPECFMLSLPGGRCEACLGSGIEECDAEFVPAALEPCGVCLGKRFKPGVLHVEFEGKNISEVLELSSSAATALFPYSEKITRALSLLEELGLGGFCLGMPVNYMSSSAYRRLRLAELLQRKKLNKYLLLLDQPFAGLATSELELVFSSLSKWTKLGGSLIYSTYELDAASWAGSVVELKGTIFNNSPS